MTTAPTSLIRGPWAIVMVFLGLLCVIFLAPTMAFAQGDESDVDGEVVVIDQSRLVPDLVLQVADSDDFEANLVSVTQGLSELSPVDWVANDGIEPRPNLLVGLRPDVEPAGVSVVQKFVEDHPAAADITLGGRAHADGELRGRINRSLVTVALMAAFVIGGLVAWLIRPVHGALIGGALFVVGLLSSAVGSRPTLAFDGSIVTTSVPAVLAGLLVAAFLALRLLQWFAEPEGDDLAEMIRRSIADLGTELLLLGVSLAVVTVFLQFIDPGRSTAAPVFLGVLTAVLLTLAIVAPALAALHGSGRPATLAPDDERRYAVRNIFGSRPDGRDFPVAIILIFGFVFGFLSLVAMTGKTTPLLVDSSDLAGPTTAPFDEQLASSGGDPTGAILARFPSGTDRQVKDAWIQRVSELANVGRVDTTISRAVGGVVADVEGSVLGPLSTVVDGDEAPSHALVVPTVSGRSDAAVQIVEAIRAENGSVEAQLSGVPVAAWSAGQRDRSLVWVTILALTLVAGVTVFGLTGDWNLAAIVGGLRMLDSVALVGLYHLVVGAVAGPELLVVVFLVSIGSGLYEIGILRRLLSQGLSDEEDPLTAALDSEGWAAAVAMIAVAFGALGFLGAGAGTLARHGLLLTIVLVAEIVVGLWLMRPAILGARAMSTAVGKPVRDAVRALIGTEHDERRAGLTAVVEQLLLAEFQFQADPAVANIEEVFVGNTPLFRNAVDHHRNLAQAGLRIVGRSPQLRTLQVVSFEPRPTVNVTVDHPVRQLVDHGGKVVGIRKAERRTMMLWLEHVNGASYRIADSVELGAESLVNNPASAEGPAAMMLSME